MYDFWSSMLLEDHTYQGKPFGKTLEAPNRTKNILAVDLNFLAKQLREILKARKQTMQESGRSQLLVFFNTKLD
jgi:hypothetical protein